MLVILLVVSLAIVVFSADRLNETGYVFRRRYRVRPTATVDKILLTVDTASLVAAGHLLPDCADLRFKRTGDFGAYLPHFLVNDCGNNQTNIWIDTGSITGNTNFYFYMYYFKDMFESAETPWEGYWVFISTRSTCPVGWEFYEEFNDGRLIKFTDKGGGAIGLPGGHTHQLAGTSDYPRTSIAQCVAGTGSDPVFSAGYHAHSLQPIWTTQATATPPYKNVVLCRRKKLDKVHPEFISLMTSSSYPQNYSRVPIDKPLFARASYRYGGTGGVTKHDHSVVEGHSSPPLSSMRCKPGAIAYPTGDHTHMVQMNDPPLNESHIPRYIRLVMAQWTHWPLKYPEMNPIRSNMRVMFTTPPPFGFVMHAGSPNHYLQLTNTTYLASGGNPSHFHFHNVDSFHNALANVAIRGMSGSGITVSEGIHASEHGPMTGLQTASSPNEFFRGELWLGTFYQTPSISATIMNRTQLLNVFVRKNYSNLVFSSSGMDSWEAWIYLLASAGSVSLVIVVIVLVIGIVCCVLALLQKKKEKDEVDAKARRERVEKRRAERAKEEAEKEASSSDEGD